tara:strand:+ start:414 stop:968 length:555 start_codon:yes stop_codon:yes gene_type:complete
MEDIECLLENIRQNCVLLNREHKKRYLRLKQTLKYFRIPIIVLSGANSLLSVSLQDYVEQGLISISTACVSLLCGIIGSVELYLSIQQNMETELITSKDYYLLGIEIFKMLSLQESNRNVDLKTFLDEKFGVYQKLCENSNVLEKKILDKLCPVPVITENIRSYRSQSTLTAEESSLSSNEVIV